MALGFILIGVVLVIVAIRNSYRQFGAQLASDFTGPDNFWYWIAAVAIIGAIGYVPYLRTPSRILLALILVVFLLKNGTGFFSNLQTALASAPQPSQTTTDQIPQSIPVTLSGGSSGGAGGKIGGILGAATSIGSLFA
jgi:hypothetical protein